MGGDPGFKGAVHGAEDEGVRARVESVEGDDVGGRVAEAG